MKVTEEKKLPKATLNSVYVSVCHKKLNYEEICIRRFLIV
jgi:hypothetical protein